MEHDMRYDFPTDNYDDINFPNMDETTNAFPENVPVKAFPEEMPMYNTPDRATLPKVPFEEFEPLYPPTIDTIDTLINSISDDIP